MMGHVFRVLLMLATSTLSLVCAYMRGQDTIQKCLVGRYCVNVVPDHYGEVIWRALEICEASKKIPSVSLGSSDREAGGQSSVRRGHSSEPVCENLCVRPNISSCLRSYYYHHSVMRLHSGQSTVLDVMCGTSPDGIW